MHRMTTRNFFKKLYTPAIQWCRGFCYMNGESGQETAGDSAVLKESHPPRTSDNRGAHQARRCELESFRLQKVPFRDDYSLQKCDARRQWVEEFTGTPLPSLSGWWGDSAIEPDILKGNIENPIGLIRVPLAVAGPVLVSGEHAKGLYLIPMATTEGALVASASRGIKAMNDSGGVAVNAYRQIMIRAPMFYTDSPQQAHRLGLWMKEQLPAFQQIVSSTSKRGRLADIDFFTDAEILHVRFMYTTGEAAGQNMTTSATWEVLKWIFPKVVEEFQPDEINIRDYVIETTLSGDKRYGTLNLLHGRGISTWSSVHIPEAILQRVLKVESGKLLAAFEVMSRVMTWNGTAGVNLNACNLLAAVYAATGQDIACIVEGSQCSLSLTRADQSMAGGGILAKLRMPCLVIGTVGGGTNLPTQQDCLKMVNCTGPQSSLRLAEIITAATLGLELSTTAALASNQFAQAHERLGRNKPEVGV